jgi:flagellar basal body-associated protein FliL
MRLRDYTPRGYNARHILILIVPMIIFVVSMTLYFFYTHVEQVNSSSRAPSPRNWPSSSASGTSPQEWPAIVDGFAALA